MVEVLDVENRVDKNGKKYKYFKLFSPAHKVTRRRNKKDIHLMTPSKYCGYIAYEVNYSKRQLPDPGYHLNKGDSVPGRIVTKKVEPYIANGQMLTTCTVPVFCPEDNPIEFEIEMFMAFDRAGKKLAKGELDYGEIFKTPVSIAVDQNLPKNCIIVKQID